MTLDLTLAEADVRGVTRPRRRVDGIVERALDGELVVYDTSRQRVHILNPTATIIWQLCDGDHLPRQIVAELIERFPGHRVNIHEDVPLILQMLAEEDLLSV